MSDEGRVEIRITGSIDASLSASTAQANAEISKLGTAGTVSAKQFSEALKAADGDLRKLSGDALEAGKTGKDALLSAARGAEEAEGATKGLNLTTSGAIQEYVRLGHEVMQGNFSRIPGTLVVMASRMGGLETAAASVSAAVANIGGSIVAISAAAVAAGGAIAYMAAEEVVAAEAAEHLKLAADFAGNFKVDVDAIEEMVKQLDQLPNISGEDASQTAQAILSLKDVTEEEFRGMTAAVAAYSSAANVDMGTAKDAIVHAFADPLASAREFIVALHNVSPALTEQVNRAVAAGDASGTLSLMLRALDEKYRAMVPSIADANTGIFQSYTQFSLYMGALEQGVPIELRQQYVLEVLAGRYGALADQIARAAAAEASRPKAVTSSSETVNRGLQDLAQRTDLTNSQILARQIEFLQAQRAAAGTNAKLMEEIDRDLGQKRAELARRSSADLIAAARASADAGGLIGQARANAEIAADRALLADHRLTAEDRLSVERDLNAKLSALHQQQATVAIAVSKEARNEVIRELEEESQRAREGSQERIDADRKWLAYAVSAYGERSAQAHAANDALIRDQRALADAAARDAQATAATRIKAANDSAQSQMRALDQEARYFNLTSSEEVALATKVENARDAAVRGSLAVALKAAGDNLDIVRQVNKQIEEATSEHQKRLDDITRRGLDIQVEEWGRLNSRVFSAEDTLIGGLFSRQQTLGQTLRQAGLQFLQQMLADDLKYWTERELLALEGVHAENAAEHGGFSELIRLLTGKTIAVQASTATKTATVAAGEAANTTAVTAGESAQVAAIAAGEAAKVGIKAASVGASNAIGAAADSKSILNAAYVSAAQAYKSVMESIPPPANLALAPIAAGVTFAAVAAWDVISAEGGQTMVPVSRQLTELHYKEMVLDAGTADAVRDMAGSRSKFDGSLAGAAHYHKHYWNLTKASADDILRNPGERRKIEKVIENSMRNAVKHS